MLLRRITKHVTDQNWFAVFIDFIIVVVGVFIGIQVANWNETQSNKKGVRASLERLNKEVSQNIVNIDEILTNFKDSKGDMNAGREALNACAYTPENQAALERVLFDLVEDIQPNFVTVALDQLSRQDRYQDLLSSQFQMEFGTYSARLTEEYEQLNSHYNNMWAHHTNYHPDINAFFSSKPDETDGFEGWGFKLNKPFEEICKDASFRNRFINTVGFYTSINRRLLKFKTESEKFQNALNKELEKN